jgi:hypothetical protein
MDNKEPTQRSLYSPAERNMILCMTRERACTPEICLKPNACWMKEEERDLLIKEQKEWEATHG